jgi:hypothetical protein
LASTGSPPTTQPAITVNSYGKGFGIAYAFYPGFHYQQSANWDDTNNEPSQGVALPYGWRKAQRDLIIAPAKIACTPKPITLTQNGNTIEMVEACVLESDKGIAIVLLNWSDTPAHVPIKDLTLTLNNSTTNIPVGSLISSTQGNIVTPKLTTTAQPPFTITLSQLDYVDVVTIDAGPHLVRTETVNQVYLVPRSTMIVADVYPFHIIGGHLSVYGLNLVEGGLGVAHVVVAEVMDNQIQGAVDLVLRQDTEAQDTFFADIPHSITGSNPMSGRTETVSHITHLLLYNGGNNAIADGTVSLAMTVIYSP